MNFGESEGLHYDGLTGKQKEEINSADYHPSGGESREQVSQRFQSFFDSLP